MIWLVAYAILGMLTSLLVPFLLTERHERDLKKLGGESRVALCVIAGVVWPSFVVEYAIRGTLGVFRAMTRLTWLGFLNFVVLQWFGMRLGKCFELRERFVRATHLSYTPDGGISMGYQCDEQSARDVERVFVGYRLLRWIVPLTGWWSDFVYIKRRTVTRTGR